MYLKIVTDNETHYIRCTDSVSVKQGTHRRAPGLDISCEKSDGTGQWISLLVGKLNDEDAQTVVTDGKVYLLDDSGKTVDVIQR
jgi:hypothetical protein